MTSVLLIIKNAIIRKIRTMNKKQLVVLWVGIIIFVSMALYPPWFKRIQRSTGNYTYTYDYACLFYSPGYRSDYKTYSKYNLWRLNYYRLTLQYVILLVVIGGAMISFSDHSKKWRLCPAFLCPVLRKVPKTVVFGI